jgi:hypothetical protein
VSELDRHRRAQSQRLDRGRETPIGEDGRVDPSCQLAQLVERGQELVACGFQHLLGRDGIRGDLRLREPE